MLFVAAMRRHWHEDDLEQLTPDDVRAYCAAVPEYVIERDDLGYTPLFAACLRGKADIARVLLQAGADPNCVTDVGEFPLQAAIPLRGEPFDCQLFDLLLGAGANVNVGSEPPLHLAVVRGHLDLVAYLVKHGADPNFEDCDGEPPIFWARGPRGYPDVRMVHLLLELGADITRRDGVGRTLEERIGPEAMREVMRQRDE